VNEACAWQVNTCLQFSLLGLALSSPLTGLPSPQLVDGLCYVVAASTLTSTAAYAHAYFHGRILQERER
jgi:hypothetical protein